MTDLSEETGQRIAKALERLADAVEKDRTPLVPLNEPGIGDIVYVHRPATFRHEPMPYTCLRCIPSHGMDWANPCKSHGGVDHGRREQSR